MWLNLCGPPLVLHCPLRVCSRKHVRVASRPERYISPPKLTIDSHLPHPSPRLQASPCPKLLISSSSTVEKSDHESLLLPFRITKAPFKPNDPHLQRLRQRAAARLLLTTLQLSFARLLFPNLFPSRLRPARSLHQWIPSSPQVPAILSSARRKVGVIP